MVERRVEIKEYDSIYPEDLRYLNHNNLLSHNADISWSQSIRNLGKSYDAMRLVEKTMENGRNCTWLRWDRKECKLAEHELERFFDDDIRYIKKNIPNSNVSYITDIESDSAVYIMPVKDASGVKGMDIPDIKWCIYDECIPEFYDVQTRKFEEFNKFMSLYVTLKRDTKDFRVLMMSNCIDWFTEYTRAWGIMPFAPGKIRVFNHVTVMETEGGPVSVNYKIAFENVYPSQAMIERNMKDYAIRGQIFDISAYFGNTTSTNYNLIEVCPDLSVELSNCQFKWDKGYYAYRIYNGIVYFTKVNQRKGIDTYVFKVSDLSQLYEDMTTRSRVIGTWLEDLINRGRARFNSGHTYNVLIGGLYELRKRI